MNIYHFQFHYKQKSMLKKIKLKKISLKIKRLRKIKRLMKILKMKKIQKILIMKLFQNIHLNYKIHKNLYGHQILKIFQMMNIVNFINLFQMIGKNLQLLNILMLKANQNFAVSYIFQKKHHLICLKLQKRKIILNYMFVVYL